MRLKVQFQPWAPQPLQLLPPAHHRLPLRTSFRAYSRATISAVSPVYKSLLSAPHLATSYSSALQKGRPAHTNAGPPLIFSHNTCYCSPDGSVPQEGLHFPLCHRLVSVSPARLMQAAAMPTGRHSLLCTGPAPGILRGSANTSKSKWINTEPLTQGPHRLGKYRVWNCCPGGKEYTKPQQGFFLGLLERSNS